MKYFSKMDAHHFYNGVLPFLTMRGCGKSTLRFMMFMEYLRILKMSEYLNKYHGVVLPKVDLTGVVKEYFHPIHSENYVGLDAKIAFIDETVLSSDTFKIDYLGDLIEPTPDWPKQNPWGYLHEDGTKQYI